MVFKTLENPMGIGEFTPATLGISLVFTFGNYDFHEQQHVYIICLCHLCHVCSKIMMVFTGDQIPGPPRIRGSPRGVHLVSSAVSSFHVRLVLCAEKPFAGGLIGGESVPWPRRGGSLSEIPVDFALRNRWLRWFKMNFIWISYGFYRDDNGIMGY